MKLIGLKEEPNFNEIAPKYTQMCTEVIFWGNKKFFCFVFSWSREQDLSQ